MEVEFEQDGATLVSSDGAETIRWDVATGARKDKVDRQFAFTKATNGRYIVTQKGDLMFVYDTQGVIVNADGEEKVPIAFFRAPSPVVSVSCAGERAAPCLRCTPRGSQTEVRREQGRGGLSNVPITTTPPRRRQSRSGRSPRRRRRNRNISSSSATRMSRSLKFSSLKPPFCSK